MPPILRLRTVARLTATDPASQRGNDLVKMHIHPTSVMAGYRLAMREAVRFVKENMVIKSGDLERQYLINAAKVGCDSAARAR